MKFKSIQKIYQDRKDKGWCKWFAWKPVKVGIDTVVWLSYVERRVTGMVNSSDLSTITYDYRLVETPFNK